MKDVSDVLIVSFDSGLKDESALCVARKHGEKIVVLKMELGEQADILYHLLTEQTTKAEIRAKGEGIGMETDERCKECKKDWTKCGTCPVMMKWVEEHKHE